MIITKICMPCFRKYFGDNAKPQTFTWSVCCQACKKPTPPRGLLIKADVTASALEDQAGDRA